VVRVVVPLVGVVAVLAADVGTGADVQLAWLLAAPPALARRWSGARTPAAAVTAAVAVAGAVTTALALGYPTAAVLAATTAVAVVSWGAWAVEPDLRDTAAFLGSPLAGSPAGVGFLDRRLCFVAVNDALAAMNGVPADQHVGRTPMEILPDVDAVVPLLERVLRDGEVVAGVEVTGATPAEPGVPHVWLESLHPVRDRRGRPIGIGIVAVDITEDRRSRDRTEEVARRLSLLQRVTDASLTHLKVDHLLPELATRLRDAVQADHVHVLVVPPDGGPLVRTTTRAAAPGAEPAVSAVELALAQRALDTRRVVVEPRLPPDAGTPGGAPRSCVAAPLVVDGDVVGVLQASAARPDRFGLQELELLRLVADRAALALDRVRLFERQEVTMAALRESEQRTQAILHTAVDAIVTIDREGCIETLNPSAERMFGWSANEAVGRNVTMLMPEPYRSEHAGYLERYERTGEARIIGIGREVVGRRRDGEHFPLDLAVSELPGAERRYAGFMRDITLQKQVAAQLADAATSDSLTGLANRALVLDRLSHAILRLARGSRGVAVLFLDLDRFKTVNDSLGHAAGDELLIEVARRLRRVLRPSDTAAHPAGDEFVVVCEDLGAAAGAVEVADRILDAMRAPVVLAGREVFLAVSVGIALAGGAGDSPERLIQQADAAMYRAKQAGGGTRVIYDERLQRQAVERLALETALHRAVDDGEFELHFQPIVDLDAGRVVATEALLRWRLPNGQLESPAAFLDVAEQTGMLARVGAWVLRTAWDQSAAWHAEGHEVGVWVNLSPRQLADDDLVGHVAAALAAHPHLDPALLCLEVTEGMLQGDVDAIVERLVALRGLGVRLAIDDFGTGYSSLSQLQRLPLDVLKIDRSFVEGLGPGRAGAGGPAEALPGDAGSTAIVRAIASMGTSLGLDLVAEGVETPGQLEALAGLGCHLAQGYLLRRPAPAAELDMALPHGG
jgi:diguanylate cyclase (GGDEF)-like protein/PAS domain S-box-containing protein